MRHKLFCGKPSFVEKKTDEKSRIGEVYTEELQEIIDNAVPLTPKKKLQSSGQDYLTVHIS